MPAKPSYFPQLAAERPDIALCRASAAVARAAEAHASTQGLGVGQHLVLKMLAEVGACSQQALAAELRIDRSVMVTVCDDLENSGYIRRERNPHDRRSYAVTLTTPGRDRLHAAEATTPTFLDATFAALTPTERTHLTTLLTKLLTPPDLDR